MAMFTLHRNYTLRTTKGHSIEFKKGIPTWVPPLCEADVVAIGAVPDESVDVLPKEDVPAEELTPVQRKEKLFDAFGTLIERNERGDFTANNQPHCKKLNLLVNFEVSPEERDEAWQEFQTKQREAETP